MNCNSVRHPITVGLTFLSPSVSILLKKQVPLAAILSGILFIRLVELLHAPRIVTYLLTETKFTN
ncbi:hypothetical protein HMF3257_04400 [Spirosoma telluris]|uniref:Uncharacterized protein n=1 Tax=Spirosoma telluris TaxID=2183553 RepID=A0A327NF37_9BACT|nr:hypothetical protein HMF3257_04400 [Spirosoma telluris]